MKKTFVILVLLIFSPNLFAWEKVPVPDSVDTKTKSPWNFFDDFEDQNFRKYIYKNNKCCGKGRKPYKFKQDPDGNTYLEITVKHGWNSNQERTTERAEISPREKRAREKIIWYGFKVRLPKDFIHIDDRVLFNQFKNNFKGMKKSPLLGLRFMDEGKRLKIGGDTGGVAHKSSNEEEYLKYGIRINYYLKNNKWYEKKPKYQHLIDWSLCFTSFKPPYCYIDNKKDFKNKDKNLRSEDEIRLIMRGSFDATPLGEWTTYKVGIYNTKTDSGFVKVYKDDILIFDYEGVTFDWKGPYYETLVRIGPYRDSDPTKEGYPPQSIHYDDFTVVSDKKTLDKYLN